MAFVKKSANLTPIVDTVFAVVDQANRAKKLFGVDQVVDATIGSLYGENKQLVAYDSVFRSYDALSDQAKAKYASSFVGNESYRKQIKKWILGNNRTLLATSVIATPGGTGAISSSLISLLDRNETIILPKIGWSAYELMAEEMYLNTQTYELFDQEVFHLASFQDVCRRVMQEQGKVVVVINDPCHNPTGYSMSVKEWQEVISFLNELSVEGTCCVINDIAYLDYAYESSQSREYMRVFETISDHVMVIMAFSCSKSLTSYGLRLGAAMIVAKQPQAVREVEVELEKVARSYWSNVANAAMDNFVEVTTTHLEQFMAEKAYYTSLLQERSAIFVKEAKECGLLLYPYHEGFFVTIKFDDNEKRDEFHQKLVNHLIFTVKVNQGIRVAICSLPVASCRGLAKRMKDIMSLIG